MRFMPVIPSPWRSRVPAPGRGRGTMTWMPPGVEPALRMGRGYCPRKTFLLLLLFQVLGAFQLYFTMPEETKRTILLTVAVFIAAECFYYVIAFLQPEAPGTGTAGIFSFAGSTYSWWPPMSPNQLLKQLIAIIIGMVVFCILQFILRYGTSTQTQIHPAAGALVLLAANLVFGRCGSAGAIDKPGFHHLSTDGIR